MVGTIVNSLAIIVGAIIGILLKGGIPKRFSDTIFNGLGLCVLFIGIQGSLQTPNPLIMIVSVVLGGILGEIIDIDKRIEGLGEWIEGKFSKFKGESKVAEGFVTSTLIFCVGAMAIVGSLEGGIKGQYDTLFAKSALDGVSSVIFGASLGIGVLFSAVSVFLYQGSITLLAGVLGGILSQTVITYMSGVGSLLIIGLALNMLDITKIKVANLLPSIFIPIIISLVFPFLL